MAANNNIKGGITVIYPQVIELPVKHPELFEALGIAQPKVRRTLFSLFLKESTNSVVKCGNTPTPIQKAIILTSASLILFSPCSSIFLTIVHLRKLSLSFVKMGCYCAFFSIKKHGRKGNTYENVHIS